MGDPPGRPYPITAIVTPPTTTISMTTNPRYLPLLLCSILALSAACSGDRAEDVGEVATSSAAAPMDTTPAGTPAPPAVGTVNESAARNVSARLNEWRIELLRDTVPAGEITFLVTNGGTMEHAFEVEGEGIERETKHLAPGASATLSVELSPGRYKIYCPIEEDGLVHAAKGMRTVLYVGD
ncbi:hypothetical protein BH23GEM4_BH23GEM4_14060 [soil metagenome]